MLGPFVESRLNRDYNDILSALCAEGAEFLVVGAYAVGVHGIRFGAALLDLTEEDLASALARDGCH
jgi:hypothetical protein